MRTIEIIGQRGSWFATASGRQLPVLWKHQFDFRTMVLKTDWVEFGREETASKREEMREYFRKFEGAEAEFILAEAVDTDDRPHEKRNYLCIYLAEVLSTDPEIKLKVIDKVAKAK